MKINDEGTSNAAHWHERATEAEARLAEEESAHRVTAGSFASTLVRADAAEARIKPLEETVAAQYAHNVLLEVRLAEAERLLLVARDCLRTAHNGWADTLGREIDAFFGSAVSASGCNHFPGQVNCEWCTEPERATQPVEPKP